MIKIKSITDVITNSSTEVFIFDTDLPLNEVAAYLKGAKRIIKSLSSDACRAAGQCSAFLLHATGHMPNGHEIDASISYADYYYIESLIRLRNLKK